MTTCAGAQQPATSAPEKPRFTAPAEFEPQDFIWITWSENGWLAGPPMSETVLELIKVASPHVKIRLLYSEWTSWIEQMEAKQPIRSADEARERLIGILTGAGIDLDRVELMYSPLLFGALQDPGPFFLRNARGDLAIADFKAHHPNPEVDGFDRLLASQMGVPTVQSSLVSDGGNRQSNGHGTLMIGEIFELKVNPGVTRDQIEREHLRVHGAQKVIWLKHGPKDEEWGRLENGVWGIGTGGHIDEFARFADERTVLLMEVSEDDRAASPILAETHRRMEENLAILKASATHDGKPLRIIRVPAADLMTHTMSHDELSPMERTWFEGAKPGEQLTFYLPGSYLNFVIANDVIVAPRFWREGRPESTRRKDEQAKAALESAFPGRRVVQVDITPLVHDGAGLHCYTRNQPKGNASPRN